jgi:hypothetical protein
VPQELSVKAISQLVVHVFDLLEAEGRCLRAAIRVEARRAQAVAASLAMALSFLLVAVPLLIAGVGLVAAGLMWWLETEMSRPLAAMLTGVVVLAIGSGCLAGFKFLAGRPQP